MTLSSRLGLGAALALGFLLLPGLAVAQDITLSLGSDASITARSIQLIVLITVLSLAPGLAIMVTCFPFLVTVLAILRQAIGLQQSPPNMLIVSLALFLTYFVMEPVFSEAWKSGVQPLLDHDITEAQAFERTLAPFETFMERRVNPAAIDALSEVAPQKATEDGKTPVSVLIPAFMLSEIQHAFEIGFVIFLPFLIIDLVVASILMAMGMMMVPPAVVSLPFKLAFFVLANGWIEIAGAVVKGYST